MLDHNNNPFGLDDFQDLEFAKKECYIIDKVFKCDAILRDGSTQTFIRACNEIEIITICGIYKSRMAAFKVTYKEICLKDYSIG